MFNGDEIYTHRFYLDKYSLQILMSWFEMSHFNHVLFLIAISMFNYTVNLIIPDYTVPVLTMLLFYILTYKFDYYANYHFILFKVTITIFSCPLLFILSIQTII